MLKTILIGFIITSHFLFSSSVFAQKKSGSTVIGDSLPTLEAGKARVFFGKSHFRVTGWLPSDNKEGFFSFFYRKNIDKFAHNVMISNNGTYEPLLKFVSKTKHLFTDYFYVDFDAGNIDLTVYARDIDWNILYGFYTFNFELESGKVYQFVVGNEGKKSHVIKDVTLDDEQYSYCAELRSRDSKRKDKIEEIIQSNMIKTNADALACYTIVDSELAPKPSGAFTRWVANSQERIKKSIK